MKIADIEVTAIHPERWGDDLDVVNAARVSFNKESEWEYKVLEDPTPTDILECVADGWSDVTDYDCDYNYVFQKLSDKDTKLIQYLAKHKHFSPFNHSFIKVRVKAPIFVARQLVKHEYMPWNEVSRRYVENSCEFYMPDMWRKKADNVKQGSSEESIYHFDGLFSVDDVVKLQLRNSLKQYNQLLEIGVCPEQARMVLPQNLMTEWMWSGTLKAFAKMLSLRLDPHSQAETREVAQKIRELVEPVFPVSIPALLDADL